MTIKRTELEILDQAIQFAKDMQAMQDELKLLQDNGFSIYVVDEPECENTDLDGIRKKYEIRIDNLKYEYEARITRKVKETELTNGIMALKDNIELLRWLYKDNIYGEKENK